MTAELAPLPIEIQPAIARSNILEGINHNDQWIYLFPNGYGASVVRGQYTYGGPEGKYELAVLLRTGPGDEDTELTYDTPVTDDVLGWLEVQDVARHLAAIAMLPAVTR